MVHRSGTARRALDRRNGRLSKEEGDHLIRAYEGKRPPSLDLFLDFVGLSEHEFLEVAMGHQVSPYVHDPATTELGQRTHDFDQWSRDGAMARIDADELLARWRARKSTVGTT